MHPSAADTAQEANRLREAAAFLHEHLGRGAEAKIAIVLGSGLGAFASQLSDPVELPYERIPHFPASAIQGHAGRLVAGTLHGVPLLVLEGRVHAYEGHSAGAVAFAIRALAAIGIRIAVLTNAAGGIRLDLRQGQLVLISDHINLSGLNPAAGALLDDRPRFFDMTEAYSRPLREMAHAAAAANNAYITEGVYIGVLGPSFETPAEIRAFRMMGADLVGMSTTLEAIAARQSGMEVLGISCVTNMAAGIDPRPLSHKETLETARSVQRQLAALLSGIIPRAAAYLERPPASKMLESASLEATLDDLGLDDLDLDNDGDED